MVVVWSLVVGSSSFVIEKIAVDVAHPIRVCHVSRLVEAPFVGRSVFVLEKGVEEGGVGTHLGVARRRVRGPCFSYVVVTIDAALGAGRRNRCGRPR
jgi:hypothetical protein